MSTTNANNPQNRRGALLNFGAENTDEATNESKSEASLVELDDVAEQFNDVVAPSQHERRPTLTLISKASKLTPNYGGISSNDRRSSFGGVSNTRRHSVHPNQKTQEIDKKNRQNAVSRIKSETKIKIDQEKHMPANETLTDQQVIAFKEAFDLFDNNGGGTIDALELKETLESVGIEIDESEIHDVMTRLDKDGNGEIDFDEFLDLMTNTEMFLEAFASRHDPSSNKTHERDVLLFDALTEFMKKSALKEAHEIVGYYAKKYKKVVKSYNANKGAHVVGHYADGARLIGLTEKQIEQQLKKLRLRQNFKNKGDKESPYAQPLQMSVLKSVTSPTPKKPRGRDRQRKKVRRTKATAISSAGPCLNRSELPSSTHVVQPSNAPVLVLGRQTSSSETNIKVHKNLNRKKHKIILKIINNDLLQKEPLKLDQSAKRTEQDKKSKVSGRLKDEVHEHKPGWLSQRNKMYNVVITMPIRYRSVQVDDLPRLRKRVQHAKGKFSDDVAKKKIENNMRHYKELDSRPIPSPELYKHFQRVFSAYSSAETNNRTAVTSQQLKKASKQNIFFKCEQKKYYYDR